MRRRLLRRPLSGKGCWLFGGTPNGGLGGGEVRCGGDGMHDAHAHALMRLQLQHPPHLKRNQESTRVRGSTQHPAKAEERMTSPGQINEWESRPSRGMHCFCKQPHTSCSKVSTAARVWGRARTPSCSRLLRHGDAARSLLGRPAARASRCIAHAHAERKQNSRGRPQRQEPHINRIRCGKAHDEQHQSLKIWKAQDAR